MKKPSLLTRCRETLAMMANRPVSTTTADADVRSTLEERGLVEERSLFLLTPTPHAAEFVQAPTTFEL